MYSCVNSLREITWFNQSSYILDISLFASADSLILPTCLRQ